MSNFYAQLAYNAHGGGGAPAAQTKSTTSIGGVVTFTISSSKPSRTYYNFLGWSRSSGASSGSYAPGGSISIEASGVIDGTKTTTIYAIWQHQTAYVYYNANGGSGAPSTQSHWAGYSVTLSATTPTRSGYNFKGWATSPTATVKQYDPNTSYALYTTVTLYAVWEQAASTLSASNGTMGTALTIGITRQNNSYTDTITYSFGSATGTIVTKTNNASVSWTPPTTLASQIPNASSGTCTLTCTTYSGNTVIGTSTKTITLSVPNSLAPTVSVSYADTNATCLAWGVLVQSRSTLAFTITASGQESATIASYSTTVNGTTYNSATFTTDVLLYNGTNTYSVTVTDSRGKQTTSPGTFSVVAYSVPSLTLTLCDRDDSDDEQINVEFGFSIASVSNNNDANYRLDYKLKSSSTWTNGTVQSLGAYSGSISDLIANLDGGDEWDIRINVIDSFQTTSITSEVGVSGNILLNSRHAGGLGLLMKSQAQNQLDVGKPTVHHGAVLEQFGSAVQSQSTAGTGYVKVCEIETSDTNCTAPIVIEYMRSADSQPSKLTMKFDSGFDLDTFVSSNSRTAWLKKVSSTWSLYIEKSGSTDKIEILDMHNPWSNTGITITWIGTQVSTLPTSSDQVDFAQIVNYYGELSETGKVIYEDPAGVNVSNNAWKTLASITLPVGVWIVSGYVQFPSNATGMRSTVLSTTQNDGNPTRAMSSDLRLNTGNNSAKLHFTDFYKITTSTTYYLNGYQNSGSTLTTYGRIYAVKLA